MTMKSIAASLALLSCAATPLHAQTAREPAHLNGAGPVATGGFAGVRLRIPLGGGRESDKDIRASLTLAPMSGATGRGCADPRGALARGSSSGSGAMRRRRSFRSAGSG